LTAQRKDASIDVKGLQRMVVEDGKITELLNVFSDTYEVDTFFDSGEAR
jgi:hypothetical protein